MMNIKNIFTKYFGRGPVAVVLSVVFSVLVVTVTVSAATTISTNISTGGTLTVNGVSTLTGAVAAPGGITVGSSGTAIGKLLIGTCTLGLLGSASIDASHAASSTKSYDCAVTGVVSGDIVTAQLATSTSMFSNGWAVVGAKASSTSGYISVVISNLTGTDRVPSVSGVGSSTSYLIMHAQ